MRLRRPLFEMRRFLLTRLRSYLRNSPTAFYYVMKFSRNLRGHLVTRQTDLVVEGYPRSANTYAVAAFQIAGGGQLSIASHTHSPTHVKRACSLGIPCVILIRDPIDAIGSLAVRNSLGQLSHELDSYADFYASVLPLSDRLLFFDFNDVTTRIEVVLRAVKERYFMKLQVFSNVQLAERKIFELIEAMERADSRTFAVRETHVARPSPARVQRKQQALAELGQPKYRKELDRCIQLYVSITKQMKR